MNLEQLKSDIRSYVEETKSNLEENDFFDFVDEIPLNRYVGATTEVDYHYVFGSHGYGFNSEDYFPELNDYDDIEEEIDKELASFIEELYDEVSSTDTETEGDFYVYAENSYGYHRTMKENLSLEAATNLAKELDRQAWELWHNQSVAHNDDYQVRDSEDNIIFSCSKKEDYE